MKLHELREQRAAAVTAMRTLADLAESEERDLTAEEDKRFGLLKGEIAGLDKKIERAETVAAAERAAPAILVNGRGDGNFETRARDFSITKALRAAIGDQVDAGFEREMSAEVARRSGREFQGIAVPEQVFEEQRTLTVGTSGAAESLYPTTHRPDLFIDMRRSRMITSRLGATVLSGLVGDIDIPKQIGSSAAQWVGEDGEITATDADFDDVSLSPKTCGAITSFSRRTLINARPDVEALVRRDLAAVVGRAVDNAAILGTGVGNMPKGIRYMTGVHNLTLAGPTWAQVTDFAATIESDDADIGTMGWAMTPKAKKVFRTTLKVTGDAGGGFLMEGGTLDGYQVATTTSLPNTDAESPPANDSTVVFGAWQQLLIGLWSGIDMLPNAFAESAYNRGRVLVRAMQDVDCAVRHVQSFAFANDLSVG